MTVPPYVVACFFCLTSGWLCDRLQTRGIVLIAFNVVGIIGLIMLISSTNNHVKYAGTFFYATGMNFIPQSCLLPG
jgi:nitrate/nitrite transporter NarK